MKDLRVGVAMCGSYCTFSKAMDAIARLCEQYDVTPIMSENTAVTDSRFGRAKDFRAKLKELTGKEIIDTIAGAEPIGPKGLLDVLLILPCTGNTIGKLASGITDTSVTMAAKGHLRNGRPLVIAVSSNDALGANAGNIGELLVRKNIYFVPFRQDDPVKKPCSLVADFDLAECTILEALEGRQIQPLLLGEKGDERGA